MPAGSLAATIRTELHALADPVRAPNMQAYMKSSMPYLGVPRPTVRRVSVQAAGADPASSIDDLEQTVRRLWDDARFREERYAAADLLRTVPATDRLIPLLEHLATTGAWWDHVDELAHRVADLLDASPVRTSDVVRRWSVSPDPWLRRLAIIGQLGRKDRLDQALLAAVIEPNVADREFFVRKAIGWALRDHARVDPTWVRAFVDAHPTLSPLSRREALKHLT